MLKSVTNLPAGFLGAVIGGILTLCGAVFTQAYQNHRKHRNLRQALRAEIEETKGVTEPLIAVDMLLADEEIPLSKFDVVDDRYFFDRKVDSILFLFSSACYHAQKGRFDQIYQSNSDKIGQLSLSQAQLTIQFYTQVGSIYSELDDDSMLEAVNTLFLASETGEVDTDEYQKIMRVVSRARPAYELQNKALKHLDFNIFDMVLIRVSDTL